MARHYMVISTVIMCYWLWSLMVPWFSGNFRLSESCNSPRFSVMPDEPQFSRKRENSPVCRKKYRKAYWAVPFSSENPVRSGTRFLPEIVTKWVHTLSHDNLKSEVILKNLGRHSTWNRLYPILLQGFLEIHAYRYHDTEQVWFHKTLEFPLYRKMLWNISSLLCTHNIKRPIPATFL